MRGMAENMSIDNRPKEESEGSLDSSPETDLHHPSASGGNGGPGQDGQPVKRKGGRKPIYATSEERKQRNRQAQAAFRERRTEYIKQLEEAIRVHESNLHNLQSAHRTAADECLMLRYKNSLLERILLEKGIDVQAELQAKTGSPSLGPTHMPQNMVQPPPIQRAIMNRHQQSRRPASVITPKSEPSMPLPPVQPHSSAGSPKNRPTPSSHSDSPTNTGLGFSPAPSDSMSARGSVHSLSRQQQVSQMPAPMQPGRQHMAHPTSSLRGSNVAGAPYYPTPAFQNHIEQLEQEYDTQNDMVDDSEIDATSGPGPYPTGFSHSNQPSMLSPSSNGPSQQMHPGQDSMQASVSGQAYPSMTQLMDNNVDWDPFGLSASMAFPQPQYHFDQSNMR